MDNYKLKFTRLQNEIFRFLSIKAGKSFTKRAISKELYVSPTAVAKALGLIEKENFVKIKKQGDMNLSSVELDRDNQKVIELKKIENLKLIYESGLINDLEETFPGATIILFGSYSRGEDLFNSDIDVAIVGGNEKEFKFYKKYETLLERELNFNFYDNIKAVNKELKSNLFNGIILAGAIEL